MNDSTFQRPTLSPDLGVEEFEDWYWLHADLKRFAADLGLPGSGTKPELANRLSAFLRTGEILTPDPMRRRARMPDTLTPQTLIGEGWRCSEHLRAFMVQRVGPSFSFNAAVRDFVCVGGIGLPLSALDEVWRTGSTHRPTSVEDIEPSLEFNRFRHEFRRLFPDVQAEEITKQWEQWRETPISQRPAMKALRP